MSRRLVTLFVAFAFTGPTLAATTTLDFSGPICGGPCSVTDPIDADYGSSTNLAISWRSLDAPGDGGVLASNVFHWDTLFGDLVDIAYASSAFVGEARFELLGAGLTLTLESVDGAGFDGSSYDSGIRIYDLDYGPLFDSGVVSFPFPGHTTIDLGQSSTSGLILQWGPEADLAGIDNLRFRIDGEQPIVPEPATWAMMIAGFGAVGIATRRRRQLA